MRVGISEEGRRGWKPEIVRIQQKGNRLRSENRKQSCKIDVIEGDEGETEGKLFLF